MYSEDDIYTPVIAEHASHIDGNNARCSRGKWHTHKITCRPARFTRANGGAVSITEFPTWRKRVWQHIVQYYPERRKCRGCVVLAGRVIRNWGTQCPICRTSVCFKPKRELAACFYAIRYAILRRWEGKPQHNRLFSGYIFDRLAAADEMAYPTGPFLKDLRALFARISHGDIQEVTEGIKGKKQQDV